MKGNLGILLLDDTEIVICFYAKLYDRWAVLHSQTRDLSSLHPTHPLDTNDVVAAVAEASLEGYKFHVTDWRMYSRNVPESILKAITQTTGFSFDVLTLSQEQSLLVAGILWRTDEEVKTNNN